MQQLLHFSLHSYRGVRSSAILALESCMKQFPAYIMQLLPVPLAALAKLPIPQADLVTQNADLPSGVLDSLRGAMREAAASSTISADPKAEDASAAGRAGRGLLPLWFPFCFPLRIRKKEAQKIQKTTKKRSKLQTMRK